MRNCLFILEGPKDEPKLLNSMFQEMKKDDQHCYFFRCNLHVLANLLMPNEDDELEDIDLLMTLKGRKNSAEDAEVLSHRYTDIFMVFDFEPQEGNPVFNKIRKMIAYFNDSTGNGKLYINYPMMQSYRHLTMLPDPCFEFRKATVDLSKKYKQVVAEEGKAIPDHLKSYNHVLLYSMAVHHLEKREKVLGRAYALPIAYNETEDVEVFDRQTRMLAEEKSCYVLNTAILLLVAYAPSRFLREVKTHPNSFYI